MNFISDDDGNFLFFNLKRNNKKFKKKKFLKIKIKNIKIKPKYN